MDELQPIPETIVIGPAVIRWTDARHGDLSYKARKHSWMYVRQVHGNDVVVASDVSRAGAQADAIVTATPGFTIGIQTADCGALALVGDNGAVAAVHAGWKGLQSGVIQNAAESMRELGAVDIQAALGPCIHVECYEFGEAELDAFVKNWGPEVRGQTNEGTAAFDLVAAIEMECKRAGVSLVYKSGACTGCSDSHFSFRKQGTAEREVMLVETN